MKIVAVISVLSYLVLFPLSPALAQIDILEVERELRVEITEEMSNPYNFVGDYAVNYEIGPYENHLEVSLGPAVSRCSHSSSIVTQGDLISVGGTLGIELIQTDFGSTWAVLASTKVVVEFWVPETCTYVLAGQTSGVTEMYVHVGPYVMWNGQSLCDDSGPLPCNGVLPGPGYYSASIFLDHALVLNEPSSDIDSIEFSLVIALEGAVETKAASWGLVKAQYR